MKTRTLKILILSAVLTGCLASCKDKENDKNDSVYYIVGYHAQSNVQTEDTIGEAGQYLLVSENLNDTLATCNLPDNLFTFSAEIVKPVVICGFNLFPQEYRFTYKVQMSYRPMTDEEYQRALYSCNALWITLYPIQPKYIFITSISKVQ